MLIEFNHTTPKVHPAARVAENATLVGAVTVEEGASIWYGAVLRADTAAITVGKNSNIQDNCVVHAGDGYNVAIGRNVTVGHAAIVHGCTLEDGCLVGMGAILLNGCVIGEGALVAAGALVPQGKVIPPHTLVVGSPAKVLRPLTEAERAGESGAQEYLKLSRQLPTL